MITLETLVTGFDARSWHRLVTLVLPGLASRAPHEHLDTLDETNVATPAGMIIVVYEGRRIVRAWHTRRGLCRVGEWPGRETFDRVVQQAGARFGLAIEAFALDELLERFGSRLRSDDDAWTTLVVALDAVREFVDEGRAHMHPRWIDPRVPIPAPAMLRRAFDVVIPDGRAALVVLFDDHQIDTAVYARRRGAGLDLVCGPEKIREIVGELGGDYRRDHRPVRAALERELGAISMGLFANTRTLHSLLRASEPGAWALAMAARDVVFDPLPAWLGVAAGAGAVRAASSGVGALVRRTALYQSLEPRFATARALVDRFRGAELRALMRGNSPLRLISTLLRRSTDDDSPARDITSP